MIKKYLLYEKIENNIYFLITTLIRTSDLHRDLGINAVRKEIEIATKHSTRLRPQGNIQAIVEGRLKSKKIFNPIRSSLLA